MQSHLPAGDSRAVVFATTEDGLRLPVIDVTHSAFLAWDRRNRRVPSIVTRLLTRLAARRSPLLRKILASDNGYLDSISTYMFKLGADHLPPGFDGPVDRKVAAAPHVALVGLRMQQIARLLAEALPAPLADAPDAPLYLVNIAERMMALTSFCFFARGLEGLVPLAERSGYEIADSRTAVVSRQVLLRPRATE
jgi:hypothetical protein